MDRKEYQKKYKEEYKKRKKQVCVTLRNDDYFFLEKEAKKQNLTANQFFLKSVQKSLINYHEKESSILELSLRLKQLNAEVQEIAHNVNNMAHNCNLTKGKNFDVNELLLELKKLSESILKFTD